MIAARAASAYRSVAATVAPLTAVVMLYDGTITALQRTVQEWEARRFEESHKHLLRATTILRGLDHNLDYGRGGAVAERLHATYNALILAALRAFGRSDARARYRRIVTALIDMRNAWATLAGLPARPDDQAA